MSNREELSNYVNERLYIEGVLIDINKPNKKNKFRAGLVFASVCLPNENIELDHIVIAVPESFIYKHELRIYDKYAFTAKVGTYSKRKYILGTPVNTKSHHLTDINQNRFKKIKPSCPEDLSRHIKNRLATFQKNQLPINMPEINRILRELNEGERERYLSNISMTTKRKDITHADILDSIY